MDTLLQAYSVPAHIELARVLDVNVERYTVSVACGFSKKPQTGISFASPYQHFDSGEGVYFMPEVGSLCWVCFPSDGNRPFVLAWAAAQKEGNFKSRKEDLNPGDIFLGTRDGNRIVLRRGGVVEIGGGGLCQRLFLPVTNTIRDFCENYGLHTLAGDLEWSVNRPELTKDGKRPCLLSLKAREWANDPQGLADLLIGSHGEGDDTILSLTIRESGSPKATRKIRLELTKTGNVTFKVAKNVTWEVGGDFFLSVKEDAEVRVEGEVAVSAKNMDLQAAQGMQLKAGTEMTFEAPLIRAKQTLAVGASPQPVALATPLLTWLVSHSHPSPGAPPSVPPPAATILSTTLLGSTS